MPITPEAIIAVIGEEASIDPAKLTADATLEELGIASLDVISTLFTLEDRFGLVLEPEDLSGAKTVQDFVDVVMAKSEAQ